MRTVLVLSGVSSSETVERFPYRPDFVFDNVGAIDWDALAAGAPRDGQADAPPGEGGAARP